MIDDHDIPKLSRFTDGDFNFTNEFRFSDAEEGVSFFPEFTDEDFQGKPEWNIDCYQTKIRCFFKKILNDASFLLLVRNSKQ